MKHMKGNIPKCYECGFYKEEEDARTKKNGRILHMQTTFAAWSEWKSKEKSSRAAKG